VVNYLPRIVGRPHEGSDNGAGDVTACGQNLMMSVLFVGMLLERNSLAGQSVYIATRGPNCSSVATTYNRDNLEFDTGLAGDGYDFVFNRAPLPVHKQSPAPTSWPGLQPTRH
jgi:hypothetical protein